MLIKLLMDKWSKNHKISKFENPKGFEVIQLPTLLARAVLLDTPGCDLCGEAGDTDTVMYYIAAIDQVYCAKCFAAWYDGATRYKSEIAKEKENCERVIQIIKSYGWWDTPLN